MTNCKFLVDFARLGDYKKIVPNYGVKFSLENL
jgi:hypothetical protein